MQTLEEDRRPTVTVEELLNLMKDKKESEPRRTGRAKLGFRAFPVSTIILGLLIVALGVMITVLKSDIAVLKSDIVELGNLKTQVATLDAKRELSVLEGRMDEMKRDREAIKGEIAQFRGELDLLKMERKRGRK